MSAALLLVVVCGGLFLPSSHQLEREASKLPDDQLLLDALASAVKQRQDRSYTLRLLDMSQSPPREYTADALKLCESLDGVTFRAREPKEGANEDVKLVPFLLDDDGKRILGLDTLGDEDRLGALFLLTMCEPYPVKLINKTDAMTLEPARRQLLAEDATRPSGGFFYRLDDPEKGSGIELDFELERVLRLVVRQKRGATALEVELLSETVAERGDPPKPVSVWRYALRRGKKVIWIIEVS